jgi:hypothetical protein
VSAAPFIPAAPLSDCGCCEGLEAQTPVTVANPPGLSAIAYRAGTHAQFKASLLAALSTSRHPALQALNTREESDFAIALLDAWATVADVLTFYQERIANEAYLRTATELRSVLELARAIGYEVRPGVAAAALLAFEMEEARGAPRRAMIPSGVKVQSIPGPGELPQVFETVEAIEARPAWNRIRPRLTEPPALPHGVPVLVFQGISTQLRPGDGLLVPIDNSTDYAFRRVVSVEPHPEALLPEEQSTVVRLADGETVVSLPAPAGSAPTTLLGPLAPFLAEGWITAGALVAASQAHRFETEALFDHLRTQALPPRMVLALRTQAAIFGHNAPRWDSLPAALRDAEPNGTTKGPYHLRRECWADASLYNYNHPPTTAPGATWPPPCNYSHLSTTLYLDNLYPGIGPGSPIVLVDGSVVRLHEVSSTGERSISE